MKRLLREPLFHFLLLGAVIFALDGLRNRAAGPGEDEILVSSGRVENLAALFAKTWQRPPTEAELRGLVDDFILEEALYREGVALGVDQNDTIIRRRVRQKMEFVVDDIIEQAEPTEADLQQWLREHPESYTRPERYRFRHLFLNPERRGTDLTADAARILIELRDLPEDSDPRRLGDPSLIEHAFADESARAIASTFGENFVDSLATLPIGEWSGPVESAYGAHLVRVDGRTEGQLQPFDAVREAVRRDWAAAKREEAVERFREGILARYRATVEWPVDPVHWNGSQSP